MSQQAFFFDGTRCSGCKTCLFACKDAYDLDVGTMYRRVYEYAGGETKRNERDGTFETTCFAYNVSIACNHCDNPVCVQVCPTEAMHKDPETGLVSVNERHCIGCGYCALSCPYHAPKVDRDKGHSVKCDGCIDRVTAGEKPVCVEACPARALDFGPAVEMAKLGERAAIAPLPDPAATVPNLFIKPPDDARPAESKDGAVSNLLEVGFRSTAEVRATKKEEME